MIDIHTKPVGTGQVSIASAFGVPVIVTIKGHPIIETGSIADSKAVTKQDGKTKNRYVVQKHRQSSLLWCNKQWYRDWIQW